MVIKRVRDLREDNDLTQKEISHFLVISQSYYSEIEAGKKNLTVEMLIALAKYYHVSTDYLLSLSDKK